MQQAIRTQGSDERRVAFVDGIRDAPDDAWDCFDRPAVLSALDRLDSLKARKRRELYGALTAVMWSARGTT